MSISGYLVSPETRRYIWLGKPIRPYKDINIVSCFHIGEAGGPGNWQQEPRAKAVWKFLGRRRGCPVLKAELVTIFLLMAPK
jgi:hypothetical protein